MTLFVINVFGNGFVGVLADTIEVGTSDAGVGSTASAEGDGGKHRRRDQALFH
jgi:hypothetical protein